MGFSSACAGCSPTRRSSTSRCASPFSWVWVGRWPCSVSTSPARSTSERRVDISSVDELLTTTRAVRKRLDLTRPVGRDVILECVQLAMQAPTASNEQDWRWLVSIGAEYLAQAAATASDPQTQRVYQSALGLTETLAKVPVHVIPCLGTCFDGSNLLAAASAWASIIPAGWSFLLALRSRGLGSVWTTMHLAKEREVGELLGIPATVTQAALFPVAYTIGNDFRPASRPPAETITFWNTWGEY